MKKTQLTFIIIAVGVALILGVRNYMIADPTEIEEPVLKRVKGDKNAKLHITEYIDFQCPSCAYGAKYLNDIMNQKPGLIRLEMRYFPLRMHKHAVMASRYAECALQQDKFWEYHDRLIDQQKNWKNLVNAMPAFDQLAQDVGLEPAVLQQCLSDESVLDEIERHKAEGKALGINSTPTYFINGEMVVGTKSLMDMIRPYLMSEVQ